jgi:enoyl-CoA hydratase/carnithine racemase
MSDAGFEVSATEGIAEIVLDRPHKRNALDASVIRGLIGTVDRLGADDAVRAIVLAAHGEHFCVGADLSAGARTFDAAQQGRAGAQRDLGGVLALHMLACPKPIIAAVQGTAAGIGASMTLACDLRLAAATARFSFPFLARGLCPDACASWLLPRAVGPQTAAHWLYTARVLPAAEAQAKGLLLELCEAADLRPRARQIALEIATKVSPVAVAYTKQLLARGFGSMPIVDSHRLESQYIRYMSTRPDVAEGVTSFLEKRSPKFPLAVTRDMPPFFPWWPPSEAWDTDED